MDRRDGPRPARAQAASGARAAPLPAVASDSSFAKTLSRRREIVLFTTVPAAAAAAAACAACGLGPRGGPFPILTLTRPAGRPASPTSESHWQGYP